VTLTYDFDIKKMLHRLKGYVHVRGISASKFADFALFRLWRNGTGRRV